MSDSRSPGSTTSGVQGRLDGRDLDAAMAEMREIVEVAREEFQPVATVALFSGGNDSTVLVHAMREYVDLVAMVNTGIGIEETRDFARKTCASWRLPLLEVHPDQTYEEVLDLLGGFPGPRMHSAMYQRLKERALRKVQRMFVRNPRQDRILYLTGVRAAESRRRMGYGRTTSREGSVVWCNPLYFFSNDEMHEYRQRFDLPRNEVSDHLHLSGECLCGAFARPGELDEIEWFYPEVAARIKELEATAEKRGWKSCKWGAGGPSNGIAPGPLCTACVGQESLDVEAVS